MVVRCTQKLFREMRVKKKDVCEIPTATDLFEDWHANLLWIERRKCLLMVDSKTLFTFLIPDVLRKDLLKFGELLRSHCAETLWAWGVDPSPIPTLAAGGVVTFAKTNDRRVIGSMNDYAFHFKLRIEGTGGLRLCSVTELSAKMNDMPMSVLGYGRAISAVKYQLRGGENTGGVHEASNTDV